MGVWGGVRWDSYVLAVNNDGLTSFPVADASSGPRGGVTLALLGDRLISQRPIAIHYCYSPRLGHLNDGKNFADLLA